MKRTRGRPPIDKSTKARTRSLAFNDKDWDDLTKLGRAKWIRKMINQELNNNKPN